MGDTITREPAVDASRATGPLRWEPSKVRHGLFEIAIVAIGVILALLVDEWRQSRSDRDLRDQTRAAITREIDENRARLATKFAMMHDSYVALGDDPSRGPALVTRPSNLQLELSEAAWSNALNSGSLRLLPLDEQGELSTVYGTNAIYQSLIRTEMQYWTELAIDGADQRDVQRWRVYAQRLSISGCLALLRLELLRNPRFDVDKVQPVCMRNRPERAPADLYRELGIKMPQREWRPGGNFDERKN